MTRHDRGMAPAVGIASRELRGEMEWQAMLRGRMGRPLYALGVVLSWIAAFIAYLVAFFVGFGFDAPQRSLMVLVISWALIALVSLPLHVRRLHDVDLSGWWLLVPVALTGVLHVTARVALEPYALFTVGGLVVALPYALTCAAGFVWPGHRGSNRYGDQPGRG